MLTSSSQIQDRKEADRLEAPFVPLPRSLPRPFTYAPLVRRRHLLGGLDSDIWVPLSRGKDDDLIQKLVDPGDQILPIAGFIGHVAEELAAKRRKVRALASVPFLPTSRDHTTHSSKENHSGPLLLRPIRSQLFG